jgi:hypothetical protein
MFRVLGALVASYVVYAILRGEVFARAGFSGRMVSRETSPEYYWIVVAIYSGLSLALMTVF